MRKRAVEKLSIETDKMSWAAEVIPNKIKDFKLSVKSTAGTAFREYEHSSLPMTALVMGREGADGKRLIAIGYAMDSLIRRVSCDFLTSTSLQFAGKSVPGVCEMLVLSPHEVVCAVPIGHDCMLQNDVPLVPEIKDA